MKKQLSEALAMASTIICNGYEIDGVVHESRKSMRLECGEDIIAYVPDQEIVINSDGQATAEIVGATPDDSKVNLEFRVSIPIRECDFA